MTYVVSPLAMPVVALAGAGHALGASGRETAEIAAWTVGFTALVPLAVLVAMVRREQAQTLEVRERAARWKPLLVGAGSTALLGAVLLARLPDARALVGAAALWQAATTLLVLLVTLRWKMSIHTLSVAGTLALFLWLRHAAGVAVPTGWTTALALALPLVAWARLRLRAHTAGQVVVGALAGLLLPPLQLTIWAG